jgi:DNA-binding transcriptional LysR family regulator
MNDRFQELTVFVRAASTGSFSAAARELGLSQPSVSRIISELESRLGVKLLLRSTRKVVPTDAGASFLLHAAQILSDLERADDLARSQDSLDGVLRVTAPSILCNRILIPQLPRFTASHPRLKIECMTSDNLQDLVADRVDLAIRFGQLKDSGFVARKLGSLPRVLVASPAYLAARGVPEAPQALAEHDIIIGPLSPQIWPWTFTHEGQAYHARIEPRYMFDSADAALAAARAGLGIARIATPFCEAELASGQLAVVLPGYAPDPVDAHAVYPAGRAAPQKVRLFTEFLKQLFPA